MVVVGCGCGCCGYCFYCGCEVMNDDDDDDFFCSKLGLEMVGNVMEWLDVNTMDDE